MRKLHADEEAGDAKRRLLMCPRCLLVREASRPCLCPPDGDRPGLVRGSHGPTAHAAASAIEPVSGAQRRAVLRVLQDAGAEGLTDEEMQERLVMDPSSQRPRRVELVTGGQVVDSGRKRKTVSGRQAVVWTAKVQEKQGNLW